MSVVPTGQLRLLLVLAFLLLVLFLQHDNVLTTGLLMKLEQLNELLRGTLLSEQRCHSIIIMHQL